MLKIELALYFIIYFMTEKGFAFVHVRIKRVRLAALTHCRTRRTLLRGFLTGPKIASRILLARIHPLALGWLKRLLQKGYYLFSKQLTDRLFIHPSDDHIKLAGPVSAQFKVHLLSLASEWAWWLSTREIWRGEAVKYEHTKEGKKIPQFLTFFNLTYGFRHRKNVLSTL